MDKVNKILEKFEGIARPIPNDIAESLGIYTWYLTLQSDEDYETVKDYILLSENDSEFEKPESYPQKIIVVDETLYCNNTYVFTNESMINETINQLIDCVKIMNGEIGNNNE